MTTNTQQAALTAADNAFRAAWDEYFERLQSSYPEQVWDVARTSDARLEAMRAWQEAYDQAIKEADNDCYSQASTNRPATGH